ncbi:hypothetical protein [Domibacillus enclensis]|uniref:Uncharacterized protein n=1 Tax=Domibacillus enclensis TaxID=1017273 RepID=A0A1N6N963_9BACI|nr:hypothetical protein [Domibacillus enclensis]OXS79965.1 hypothetical protein B1B05_00300 [Domibacillus enclensis]SIP88620.1 hypothetical protein SAMN05443094_10161 [Domibacillus enclensis]
MKKQFLSLFILPFLLIGINVPAFAYEDELTGTPYEMLEKEGISLKHYIVTFKSPVIEKGYYRATASNGETIRFKPTDVEIELSVGDRVRTYWEDGGFNIAEYVKPEKIEYSINKVWYEHGQMNIEGTSSQSGDILFTDENVFGNELLPGDKVIAEFDQMFIENGLIGVYKKK